MRSLKVGLVVALLLIAGVAQAITIQPGTYKLEWRVPGEDEPVSFAGRMGAPLEQLTKISDLRVTGLTSGTALWGTTASRAIILDESKGTGSGYDTAYLLSYKPKQTEHNTKDGVRIALSAQGDVIREGRAELGLTLGPPGAQVTKRASVELAVLGPADGSATLVAIVVFRGGWYGKLKTDEGDLDVQLGDLNDNGLYNDSVKSGSADDAMSDPGDLMLLGETPDTPDESEGVIYLGPIVSYDNKLYNVSVHPAGESLDIRPYTGEAGRLRIVALDGSDRPASCANALVSSPVTVISTKCRDDLVVPPGKYRCITATIGPRAGGHENAVTVTPDGATTVTRDGLGIIRIGGPLKAVIESNSAYVAARRGRDLDIEIDFTAGSDPLTGVEGDREAVVNIRDSRGKLVHSGRSSFG